jgi:hypothetical protein
LLVRLSFEAPKLAVALRRARRCQKWEIARYFLAGALARNQQIRADGARFDRKQKHCDEKSHGAS